MRNRILAIAIISAVITSMTSPISYAASALTFPLSTKGNQIIDAEGNRVIWQGVNWYGMEN